MSTAPQPPAQPVPAPVPTLPATSGPQERKEVVVISHSALFYWWPVWAVGFLMAILTLIDNHYMAVVPAGAKPERNIVIGNKMREAIVLPEDKHLAGEDPRDKTSTPVPLKLHVASRPSLGVIYVLVLLLVIVITNVPLRGMWSVVVIITLVLLSVIFALAGWWETIFNTLALLDIRINMGGYLVISSVLFVIWLVTLMFFDRQVYMVFTPGQFKVCTEIGGGEKVYDTMGLSLERQRGDLFRHYILGLGSGDLVVKTTGAQAHHFDMPNVLFISKKLKDIELLLKSKVVDVK